MPLDYIVKCIIKASNTKTRTDKSTCIKKIIKKYSLLHSLINISALDASGDKESGTYDHLFSW